MLNIQSRSNLSSVVIDISGITDISDWANTVLDKLGWSDTNSKQELQLILKKAMNNSPLSNLERLAVIRQYFGKDNPITKKRYIYGASS